MKENKGITLVALVITIIILIILAGITISMVLGEDGLIGKAKKGAEEYKNAAANEQTMLGKINELFENNGSTGENTPSGPTVADVTVSNYGQYVDLGTNILDRTIQLKDTTTPLADWRVFKKDDNGVWLILANYMPVSKLPSGTGFYSTPGYNYMLRYSSDRKTAIEGLNSSNWKNLISENTDLYNNSNVIVKGALGLEEWVESWNGKGYTNVNISLTETAMSDGLYGYYVYKDGEDETGVYANLKVDTAGFADTLYFTHTGEIQRMTDCYLLASPAANDDDMVVDINSNNGCIGRTTGSITSSAVRPAVFLPSSIKLDTSGAVWTIVE